MACFIHVRTTEVTDDVVRMLLEIIRRIETQTEVQSEQLGYYFRTVEEYWEEILAGRRGLMFLQLAPAQREQFKAEHLAEVKELATAQGIWRDGAVHFARGWKRTA